MIDYIKYIVDGVTYSLIKSGDDTWSREENAPSVAGNYLLTLIISEDGAVTTINSSSSLYEAYLNIIVETERAVYLENYVLDFIAETDQFISIFNIENESFDDLHAEIEKIKSKAFITTSYSDSITKTEEFLNIKGLGTLDQRKSYLISLNQKGNRLSESTIRDIANSISGSDCIITFFGSDESDNPISGYGLLKIQVLSPDSTKNYRYTDISRALVPLVPSHIKLSVIKYFATWQNINDNFADWTVVSAMSNWQAVSEYMSIQ